MAALAGRAQLNLAQGKAEVALADASRAIEVLEALGEAGMHAQQRVVFLGSQRRVFELAIAAQLELAAAAERKGNQDEVSQGRLAALMLSERSRMGGLLEALARVPGTVPPELAQRRAALYELLAGKRQRRDELQEKAAPDAAAVATLSRDIEMLRVELATLEAKARGTAGPLATNASPRSSTIARCRTRHGSGRRVLPG